jgi:membrane-bound serine protease (ClpP class)
MMTRYLLSGLLLLAFSLSLRAPTHAQQAGPIYHVAVDGVVTDITIGYLQRALDVAEDSDATALIIQLQNDGGVLRSIRPFASELAQAEVPIVVYIAPEGTIAGASGAFFLSAAHIAAMAPDTSFGTHLPLTTVDTMLTEQTRNLVFDNVADQLRAWNAQHGRNTDWVDRAVREGRMWTSEQAIAAEPPIVDIVARDRDDLLTLLEGRTVQLQSGQEVQLHTLGRTLAPLPPTPWEQFLLFLADPTVVFLLIVLSFFAIYGELANPGVGILAGLSIVLFASALVGLVVLPINWLSFLGLLLAFGLIIADLFVPSHGTLSVVGMVLMIISSMTLIDTTQAPGVSVAPWAIRIVALMLALFAIVSTWFIIRARTRPVVTGQAGLINRLAEVRTRLDPEGMVFVEGALWRAVSEDGVIEQGEWVRITAVHGLRLMVRQLEAAPDTPTEP